MIPHEHQQPTSQPFKRDKLTQTWQVAQPSRGDQMRVQLDIALPQYSKDTDNIQPPIGPVRGKLQHASAHAT